MRFCRKYYAAQLLSAKMFHGDAAVAELMEEIHNTALWKNDDSKLKEVVKLDTNKLQQWVRASCLCDPSGTDRYQNFVATVVKPALSCNVAAIPANLQDIAGRFTAIIKGGEASEEDAVRLKIACSAIKGELSSHPLVCGLALQCARLVNKESRGIFTMSGRRSAETEREKSLISDAGQQLAMAAGNSALARQFGISSSLCRISLDELLPASLPCPALALRWPNVLKENFQLADQRYVKAQSTPRRA